MKVSACSASSAWVMSASGSPMSTFTVAEFCLATAGPMVPDTA